LSVSGSLSKGCIACTYIDINECASPSLHDCDTANNGICVNSYGSYSCMCASKPGFTVTGKGTKASRGTKALPCVYTDINECSKALVNTHCSSNAECTNSVGAYNCSCPARAGFTVTGTGTISSPCKYKKA
jgi:hypothetical protein